MNKITRADAIAQGLSFYFTGEPCAHGHIAQRIVSSHGCHQCRLEREAAKRLRDGATPWSKSEAERAERRKQTLARYAARHPERLEASQRKYKAAHPEKRRASVKKWDDANRHVRRLHAHTRRARKTGKVSRDIAQKLLRLQRGKCACCGRRVGRKYQLDHVVALARGGAHDDSNLQILCPPCNRRKGAKDPYDFARESGRLL
jgi:5-methylcytosine-specific restriction endonuclease McrA